MGISAATLPQAPGGIGPKVCILTGQLLTGFRKKVATLSIHSCFAADLDPETQKPKTQ